MHVLGCSRSHLHTWPERELSAEQQAHYLTLLDQRAHGTPIAHLLGEREFWSLNLKVNTHTLIPRPDTERLVELALERLPTQAARQIVDLGTGSGAIALVIASERPLCRVLAIDQSAEALAIAQQNASRLQLANVAFLQGSWLNGMQQRFDMIVSNPPYIRDDDPHLALGDLRFEPRSALTAGADGLNDIRHIVSQAPDHLLPGGWLLLEHGYDQGCAVRQLLQQAGFVDISTQQDLAGNDRVSLGCLRSR